MGRALPTRDRVRLRERLFRYPEVILPFEWPRWSRAAEVKVGFWESLGVWRGGTLTEPVSLGPYHGGPCLARYLDARAPRIGATARDIRFFRPRRTVGMNVEDNPAFSGIRADGSVLRPHRAFDDEKDTLPEAVAKAEEQREETTPQFFLRNVGRVERLDHDELAWERRESELQGFDDRALEEARRLQRNYTPPPLLEKASYRRVSENVNEMRDLMFRVKWTRFFGSEVKARVAGPLWKFFPDDAAFERFGGVGSQRVEATHPASDS